MQARDRDVAPLPASAGPLTILVMGTSLSATASWPDAMAQAVAGCTGRTVHVTRLAAPGADVRWALGQLDRAAAAAPDIVLIEFSMNDADILDGIGTAEAALLTADLAGRLAAALPRTRLVLMTMNPVSGLARTLQRPWLAAHYRDYRRLAERNDLGLLDLAPRWASLAGLSTALPDGLHPADSAATSVILPALVPYLGRIAGADCPA